MAKSNHQRQWRSNTPNKKIEAYLHVDVIAILDERTKAKGFRGRGETIADLIRQGVKPEPVKPSEPEPGKSKLKDKLVGREAIRLQMRHDFLTDENKRLKEELAAKPEAVNQAAYETKIKSLQKRLREAQAVNRERVNDMMPEEIKKAKEKLERAKRKLATDQTLAAKSTKIIKQCNPADLKFVRTWVHTDKHSGFKCKHCSTFNEIDSKLFKSLTKATAIMNTIVSGVEAKK